MYQFGRGTFSISADFQETFIAGVSFCLPAHPQYPSFIYLHIGPAPCRQTKNRRYILLLRHQAYDWQMNWFSGFSITSVDRCLDFQN